MDYKELLNGGQNNEIFVSKVNFTITLDNPKYEYWEYRERLYDYVTHKMRVKRNIEKNYKKEQRPFELFVRKTLNTLFDDKKSFVIITEYSEQEGSFFNYILIFCIYCIYELWTISRKFRLY